MKEDVQQKAPVPVDLIKWGMSAMHIPKRKVISADLFRDGDKATIIIRTFDCVTTIIVKLVAGSPTDFKYYEDWL